MPEAPERNPKQQQRAQALFEYGNDAAMKNNLDYAIEMYSQALHLDPSNLLYRQALRSIERRKFSNDPAKVGRLAVARLQPTRLRAKTERGRGNWKRLLEVCEEGFRIHPWDVSLSRDAAEAAKNLDNRPLAVWLMEAVHPQAAQDKDYLRHLAEIYEWAEEFGKAIHCFEKVLELDPADETARRRIRALSASATIARSGLGQAIERSEQESADAPKIDVPGLDDLKRKSETPEERMLRELQEEPDHARSYLQLADHYRDQNKLDEAEKVLARGRKALPNDELLRSTHAEIQLARLKRALAHFEARVKKDPDDFDSQEKLKAIREKFHAFELNELRHRLKLQPTDFRLRLQFGQALARSGRHDEAIAEFQQVRAEPNLRVEALHQAGLSFEAKGLAKLAERSYQEALKHLDDEDQALLLALHYRLGRVAESVGDLSAAEEHYNEVAANDYTYLDIAERLRALNQQR